MMDRRVALAALVSLAVALIWLVSYFVFDGPLFSLIVGVALFIATIGALFRFVRETKTRR